MKDRQFSGRMARFQISVSVVVAPAFMDIGYFTVRSGATAGRVRGTISPARKPVVHQRGAALSQHRRRKSSAKNKPNWATTTPGEGCRGEWTANTHHSEVAKQTTNSKTSRSARHPKCRPHVIGRQTAPTCPPQHEPEQQDRRPPRNGGQTSQPGGTEAVATRS